jgi:hypothetical protein
MDTVTERREDGVEGSKVNCSEKKENSQIYYCVFIMFVELEVVSTIIILSSLSISFQSQYFTLYSTSNKGRPRGSDSVRLACVQTSTCMPVRRSILMDVTYEALCTVPNGMFRICTSTDFN